MDMGFPLLSTVIFLPLAVALVLILLPRQKTPSDQGIHPCLDDSGVWPLPPAVLPL
jgi:hypothetical protein